MVTNLAWETETRVLQQYGMIVSQSDKGMCCLLKHLPAGSSFACCCVKKKKGEEARRKQRLAELGKHQTVPFLCFKLCRMLWFPTHTCGSAQEGEPELQPGRLFSLTRGRERCLCRLKKGNRFCSSPGSVHSWFEVLVFVFLYS